MIQFNSLSLENGIYRYQPIDLTNPAIQLDPKMLLESHEMKMISLIPLLPLYNPLPKSDRNDEILNFSRRNYGATKCITNGVEVTACPTFIPENSNPQNRLYFAFRHSLLRG